MTIQDRDKFNRLCSTFEKNFKITRLFSQYLELFPEAITKQMMDTLCENSSTDKKLGICALICEFLGLSIDGGIDERILIRRYINSAVRILDTKKYTENKYYKNIKIDNIKDGKWEFKTETYPAFRAFIANDMIIEDDFTEIPPLGFFEEDFSFPAVLEDGNEWMTLTPVDLDTSEEAIEKARGDVVTFGLGLGYYAYMVSEKPEVKSITIVEKSEKIIELFKKHILPQFTNKQKVKIVNSDAFLYAEKQMPKMNFDLAFVDTWRDASDGLPMYEKMKPLEALSPNTEFIYWIENFILSRKRALTFAEIKNQIENGDESMPKDYDEIIRLLSEK